MKMTGREALAIACDEIYCACGLTLWESEGGVGAADFDCDQDMPHRNERDAREKDLDHVCAWTRGDCHACEELLPLDQDHHHEDA